MAEDTELANLISILAAPAREAAIHLAELSPVIDAIGGSARTAADNLQHITPPPASAALRESFTAPQVAPPRLPPFAGSPTAADRGHLGGLAGLIAGGFRQAAPSQVRSVAGPIAQKKESETQQSIISALNSNTTATAANTAALLKGSKQSATTTSLQQTGGSSPSGAGGPGGPSGAGKISGMSSKFQAFGNLAQGTFSQATSSIFGFVSAISPSAVSTFTDSVGLLSGEIGRSLVPYVDAASESIRGAARWIGGLDDGLKNSIARVVSYSVVGLGGLAIAGRVIPGVFALATSGVRLFSGAVALATAHPVIAGVTLLTGAVITLTGQWTNLATAAGRAVGVMGQAGQPGLVPTGLLGGDEKKKNFQDLIGQLPAAEGATILARSGQPKEMQKLLKDLSEQTQSQIAQVKKTVPKEALLDAKEAKQKFDLLEPEHNYLKGFYEEQLKQYRADKFGDPTATSIPSGTRYYENVALEQVRSHRNITAQAQQIKLELSETDLLPFKFNAKYEGLKTRVNQFQPLAGPESRMLPAESKLHDLGQKSSLIDQLIKLIGGDDTTHNIKMPFQSRYSDAIGYAESVQTQALNVGDIEALRIEQQMSDLVRRFEGSRLLESVNENLEAIRTAIFGLRSWEGR